MLMRKGEADAMLCGTFGTHRRCTCTYIDVIGHARRPRTARR
jgi:phosphotransacetylase